MTEQLFTSYVSEVEKDPYFEVIQICSECEKLYPMVSYLGRSYHRPCLQKVFEKNVKDPAELKALLEVIYG